MSIDISPLYMYPDLPWVATLVEDQVHIVILFTKLVQEDYLDDMQATHEQCKVRYR